MRIAMLGTRGIPASYSGFETCVEQLGARLVERGHQVTVYCRSNHILSRDRTYRGMEMVYLPTISDKYLDTIVHTLFSVVHATARAFDVVLMFNVGNGPLAWIPHLSAKKVVLNVDGLDWQRDKWPTWAKAYIQSCERLATLFPDVIIADSPVIQSYYLQTYGKSSELIAYGSEVTKAEPGEYLARYGLRPREYVLFVGRLVPDNCPDHLVSAFGALDTQLKCVIVGDAPYAQDYIRWLKSLAGPNVVFTGYLFGDGYRELGSNAYVFVEPSGVGGTHPALVEAMAMGNCVVVNDTAANVEVIGSTGRSYSGQVGAESLKEVLADLLCHPQAVQEYRALAERRAAEHYSWQAVTTRYEQLFQRLLDRSAGDAR
jgi:glycosyltransferase involved in cell wall biosynthesis